MSCLIDLIGVHLLPFQLIGYDSEQGREEQLAWHLFVCVTLYLPDYNLSQREDYYWKQFADCVTDDMLTKSILEFCRKWTVVQQIKFSSVVNVNILKGRHSHTGNNKNLYIVACSTSLLSMVLNESMGGRLSWVILGLNHKCKMHCQPHLFLSVNPHNPTNRLFRAHSLLGKSWQPYHTILLRW